jgi:type VI secretion system protein ImpM
VPSGFVAGSPAALPGFYGKILSHGDFVNRRLPHQFINTWDRWLQAAIARGAELLPEDWLDCYLCAPIWRFALGPGVCGDDAWLGILMPSVDKVGRHFPLTIAMPVPPSAGFNETLALSDRWYSRVESLALSTLDSEFNFEQFESDLQAVPLPLRTSQRGIRSFLDRGIKPPNGMVWLLQTDPTNTAPALYQATFPMWSNFRFDGHSLWASTGTEDIYPALATTMALPPIDHFPALMKGSWEKFGWRVER